MDNREENPLGCMDVLDERSSRTGGLLSWTRERRSAGSGECPDLMLIAPATKTPQVLSPVIMCRQAEWWLEPIGEWKVRADKGTVPSPSGSSV